MTATATPPSGRPERFLLFSLGRGRFAVDGRVVRGVVPVESLTPLPRAPGPLRGVFHHLGDVVPLLDVRGALGVEEAAWKFPVLTLLVEVAPWSVGVAIDEVKGHEALPVLAAATDPGAGVEVSLFTRGVLERNGERFAILDAPALLWALRAA